jgi:glutamate carboxypeptidase
MVVMAAVALAPLVAGAGLSGVEERILASVEAGQAGAVALLRRAVDIESATENHPGVRRVGEVLAVELRALGFETRWIELPTELDRAGHLVAERRGTKGKRLLLIGHLDTVLQGEPFRLEGDRGYGSGSADMKGGDVIMIEALRALHQAGALEDRRVIVVMTGDEESAGHPHSVSRAALVEAARRSDLALAFEGAAPGVAVTARRGISSWRLETSGSQGHSSGLFGKSRGSGAVFEAARILGAFHDTLREPNLTYNPSVMLGGTDVTYDRATHAGTAGGKLNVVARKAVVAGDLRFLSPEQLERARARMREIVAASLPQTSATISFFDEMPSMPPTEGNGRLLTELDGVSRDLGAGPMAAHDPSRRGAGDISFVAALVDGLDGLGAVGEQEHATGEYCELGKLPLQIKRAALLMYRVTR